MGKDYIYYSRISIKEGLDVESQKLHLKIYDKNITRHRLRCRQAFIIKKKFEFNNIVCNECEKPLEKDDRVNPMIWVI